MIAPHTIAREMIKASDRAFREVWGRYEPQIPEEDRKEWKLLCWERYLNHRASQLFDIPRQK